MQTIIIVTGTPCTGKTTIAKKIASLLKFKYIDVNRLIKTNKIHDKYDKKSDSLIVDIKKLNRILETLIKRLKKRKYNEEKIRENLDSEILDICLNEAIENNHNIIIMDTSRKINYKELIKNIH